MAFQKLNVKDGLSHSTPYCIFQDHQGFIWIATGYGLNKYNGNEFTVYRYDPSDSTSLSGTYVGAIYEDRDRTLWIGTEDGLNRFDRQKEHFIHYKHDANDPNSLADNGVISICEDQDGVLWIGTPGGLHRFDKQSGQFQRYLHDASDPNSLSNNTVGSLLKDHRGILWIGTLGGGLNRYDKKYDQFDHFVNDPTDDNSLADNNVLAICEDPGGSLWIGTARGLELFDVEREQFHHYVHDPNDPSSLSNNRLRNIYVDKTGTVWAGTNIGLNRFIRDDEGFQHYFHDPADPTSLSGDGISSIYQDRGGILWVGTITSGLNLFNPKSTQFQHYTLDVNDPNSIDGIFVRTIHEDRDGILWIGTTRGGLNRFDRTHKETRHFMHHPSDENSLSTNNIWACYEDGDGIFWLGTTAGLNRFDPEKPQFRRYKHDPLDTNSISHNHIWTIHEDTAGLLWIGTFGGLNSFDRESEQFRRFNHDPALPNSRYLNNTKVIFEDHSNTFWTGTVGGLSRFDRTDEKFYTYVHDPSDPNSLSSNEVLSICEDYAHNLWIGTATGLGRFDRDKEIFTNYNEKDGLAHNVIFGILEDDRGNLWLSTGKGLSRFDPAREIFRNFASYDGLDEGNIFGIGGYHKSAFSGELYFGGRSGVTVFHPDSIQDNRFVPPVVISSFERYNTKDATGTRISEKGISEKKALTLSYRDNILIFEFAALSYLNSAENKYVYQLEGFSDTWIELGTENKVTFTNLNSGDYVLRVKGSNNDGVWNSTPTELKIKILPPWWQTWWAYLIYAALFFGGIYAIYRFQIQRKLAQQETKRLREIDQLKNRLYTNITHEFRTPLTVVSGMSEQIGEFLDKRAYGKIRESTALIKGNSNRLLNLINQMLDLAKLESGNLTLDLVQGDVVQYLQFITESLQSYADSKNIRLTFYKEVEQLTMDYDPDKILIIVSNLLSNALKFTQESGKVILHVNTAGKNDEQLVIKVRDTGIGLAENALTHIFDRFYQADGTSTREEQGTGIGLSLTKELVHLMRGQIQVKSTPGEGTEFSVMLPVTRNEGVARSAATEADAIQEKAKAFLPATTFGAEVEKVPPGINQNPLLLIVEDNPDIVTYLKTCLENDYQLAVAINGEEGIEKAIELIPDIVVSDVMMPKKDGFELCDTLKQHPFTSHIPIILLTAKATIEDKLTGLERGADAYLKKPFNKKELLIRLRKLIEIRKKIQQRYNSGDGVLASEEMGVQLENEFLQQMRQVVETHLADSDFSTAQLCREMGMSRSQIYRKLIALTDRSASHFIRGVRLHKARNMLKNSHMTVSEVAYEVGFKDPSYFSRTFQEEFGRTPSDTRKVL